MKLGNYSQAIVSYAQAASLDDKDSDILAKQAIAEYKLGDIKSMETTFIQAETIVNFN